MKQIKKIATSNIPKAEGAVVDSFNAEVDKTTNAPSIRAVLEKMENVMQNNIRVVTASASNTVSAGISYPIGFNVDNCRVLSVKENSSGNSYVSDVEVYLSSEFITLVPGNKYTNYTVFEILLLKIN